MARELIGGLGGDVVSPFTADQVASLNSYQVSGAMHPFTCPNRDDGKHQETVDLGVLVAAGSGWVCPSCPYTQNWAHGFMADWSWRSLLPEVREVALTPTIPDAAVEAYLRDCVDGPAFGVRLWQVPDVAERVRAGLAAAYPILAEQRQREQDDVLRDAADRAEAAMRAESDRLAAPGDARSVEQGIGVGLAMNAVLAAIDPSRSERDADEDSFEPDFVTVTRSDLEMIAAVTNMPAAPDLRVDLADEDAGYEPFVASEGLRDCGYLGVFPLDDVRTALAAVRAAYPMSDADWLRCVAEHNPPSAPEPTETP